MSCIIYSCTEEAIAEAAQRLSEGRLVAFATETVYGLGADATDDRAVAAIFEAKRRPQFNPLIVHHAALESAEQDARFSEEARALARSFWPGPLTLVLPRRQDSALSPLVSAGLDSVALRIPAAAHVRALIARCGFPIAAPSANRSGAVSPTLAAHVAESLHDAVQEILVLDGGPCGIGLESTVLDMRSESPVILRPGAVLAEDVQRVLGVACRTGLHGAAIRAPGMLASHYAPSLPVRLHAQTVQPNEALLTFGAVPSAMADHVLSFPMSADGDLGEAAANMFRLLREADQPERFCGIAVMPIPEEGLGIAINDRLRRAAAGARIPPA